VVVTRGEELDDGVFRGAGSVAPAAGLGSREGRGERGVVEERGQGAATPARHGTQTRTRRKITCRGSQEMNHSTISSIKITPGKEDEIRRYVVKTTKRSD
jgi:ribosomal protein L15